MELLTKDRTGMNRKQEDLLCLLKEIQSFIMVYFVIYLGPEGWRSLLYEAHDWTYTHKFTSLFCTLILMLTSVSWYKGLALHVGIISEFSLWEEIPIFWCFANSHEWIIVWRNFGHPILNYSNVIFLFSLVECFLGSIWSVCSCSSDLHHSLCKGLKAFSADKKDR